MTDPAFLVHFPHPGGEHEPTSEEMPWNLGDHKRKFMLADAIYLDQQNVQNTGKVVFWGEWEGNSRVVRSWPASDELPCFLHVPYWKAPNFDGPRQNTDPWVFGTNFRYSNCKQLTYGRRASALQRLTPGSVILFGSGKRKEGRFLLDTVFVVGEKRRSFIPKQGED